MFWKFRNIKTQQKKFDQVNIMGKFSYHQIWIQNYFIFIVSDLV